MDTRFEQVFHQRRYIDSEQAHKVMSASLVTRATPLKTAVRWHSTPVGVTETAGQPGAGEGVGEGDRHTSLAET